MKRFVLTLIVACMAGGFALAQKTAKKLFKKYIKNPYLRIAVGGIAVSVFSLILYKGRYSGLGTNLINASFSDGEVYYWNMPYSEEIERKMSEMLEERENKI